MTDRDMRHIANGAGKLARCRAIIQEDFDAYALRALTGQCGDGTPGQSRQVAQLQAELNTLRRSRSYRLGNRMIAPLRMLKKLALGPNTAYGCSQHLLRS